MHAGGDVAFQGSAFLFAVGINFAKRFFQRGLNCGPVFRADYIVLALRNHIGENVYMNMITAAEKSIYISTPYLILDETLITALCLAAKSGIDVRIVTPSKYDKWMIHRATQSYYRDLVEAGVHVYEYTPGFMHSKTIVIDDKAAIVGSINWDYRSLYLHFESAVWMTGTDTVHDVYQDLQKSFEVSDEVLPEELNYKKIWSIWRLILRLISPIL